MEIFPDLKPPYGKEVTQGYETPCFFVELYIKSRTKTKNYNEHSGVITLTYMQASADEADALQKYDAVREAFSLKLVVGERCINIDGVGYSWIGKDDNILQIEIEISYEDKNEREHKHPIMRKLNLKEEEE